MHPQDCRTPISYRRIAGLKVTAKVLTIALRSNSRSIDVKKKPFETNIVIYLQLHLTDIPRMGVDLGPILPPSVPLGKADTFFEGEKRAPRLAWASRPEKSWFFDNEDTPLP
jgi:hypothetical protein